MRRTAKYVGLDVHQATTVASVREQGGRVIARTIVPTEATAILEFFAGMRGRVSVALEEGTQAQWLHDLLTPVVADVVVCDRRGEPRGNKADQKDADQLSHRLLNGDLRAVYHGDAERLTLQELTRAYTNVVGNAIRAMGRLKALYRSRAIAVRGKRIYATTGREAWLEKLRDRGARFRAELLYQELDLLQALRLRAKEQMVREAQRDPAWKNLRTIPYLGPVRVALLLATLKTPWRFRTKRNLWAYAGLAVVTESSGDHHFVKGQLVRRRKRALTRGLNRNHNRVVKHIFKSAAAAAVGRPGPFQDLYHEMVRRGMRDDMARLTLARKFAAVTLRLWKSAEPYDPTELTRGKT